jgi:Na+/proline symporter
MARLISDAGGLFHIQSQAASAKLNVGIVPQNGTRAFNAFLVFMLLQWWSASISDLPDMTGQKLMATKNVRDVAKTIIFPQILSITIGLFVFLLPFIARTDGLLQASANPEQAFLSVFVNHLPAGLLVAAAAMFLISFLSVVLNNLNWGGALLVQNVYRYHIRHKATKEALNRVGVATMLVLACFGAAIAFFSESLLGIARYIFAITAGVGPVFILRWYWWRINAWSQFSAMVAALIIPNVFDLMMLTYSPFNQEVMALCGRWNMDLYPFKIIVFSILVTFVWIVVTFATAPDDEITLSKFASTVKPGGFWPKRFGAGNVFLMPRLFVWLILAVQGLLVYILFWQFSQGNYLTSSACLIAFLGLMYVAYKLLSSVNQKAK